MPILMIWLTLSAQPAPAKTRVAGFPDVFIIRLRSLSLADLLSFQWVLALQMMEERNKK